ncbi:MAG TPA: ATP-binding protein, partial [Polyangia bacterium]|nr:ATP-binding protein [Polyangia bacterium]
EAAERVRLIVRDLKIFSRPEEEKLGAVDVRVVMESSLRMAWNEIRHRARLVKSYGDVPAVAANEARLGQVFLNLVINAAQAIEPGHADRNQLRVATRDGGAGRVIVEVADTGSGIPADVIGRIFDPFFSTKPIGVGTGLGLPICYRIVTGFGGEIGVESEPGKGSVFRVTLPIAVPAVEEPAPAAAPAPAPARRARVLVVDDDEMVARSLRRMIGPEHHVVVASSARAGAEACARERFDVILCDLMMPEMTGMDLHAELARVAPEQAARMVFMTGGAFTPDARSFLERVPNERLEKPFDVEALRAIIRRFAP